MIFVYVLALIGLLSLLALAALAVVGAGGQASNKEPEDSFDLALSAVARLQSSAWRAIQELRELDSHRK
jgi:hypothetical protein